MAFWVDSLSGRRFFNCLSECVYLLLILFLQVVWSLPISQVFILSKLDHSSMSSNEDGGRSGGVLWWFLLSRAFSRWVEVKRKTRGLREKLSVTTSKRTSGFQGQFILNCGKENSIITYVHISMWEQLWSGPRPDLCLRSIRPKATTQKRDDQSKFGKDLIPCCGLTYLASLPGK